MKLQSLCRDKEISYLDTVKRWDLNKTIKDENVSQHSFWVAFYATCISEELFPGSDPISCSIKLDVIRYALFHDFDEVFSGDINHTVKKNTVNGEEIQKLLKDFVTSKIREKFNDNTPFNRMISGYLLEEREEMKIVKGVVKVCDWLSFLKYLDNEKSLGNQTLDEVRAYCTLSLQKEILFLKDKVKQLSNVDYDLEPLENLI